jgi:2-polyprenyl-6-hydroxyphenyl methylase/3-demethylubiquinone-9 3-methyltransferase
MSAPNVDVSEVERFDAIAREWWDPHGPFAPLHVMNPVRLDYVDERAGLAGKRVLDVGCGGGLLAEAMALRGARVTGIDLGEAAIEAARAHAAESGVAVDYRREAVESVAEREPHAFDIVTCMELLEHVPDPDALVGGCARLVRPGGQVFFSTITRNPKSYLLAVVAAEYVLNLLPRGTHDYARFIRPSELDAWARHHALRLEDLTGMRYDPLARRCDRQRSVDVNYLAQYRSDADEAP